ncbi:RraA family protein [Bacteroidota bacterium]
MDTTALINRLQKLETSWISDVSNDLRLLSHDIRPVNTDVKVAGIAYTIYSEGDIIPVLMGLHKSREGEVLVIDSCGSQGAMFGELVCWDGKGKKLNGIVTDGFCRDIKGIRNSGFPAFASDVTPMVAGKSKLGKLQVELNLGGVTINPGDFILGDQDGVVIIDPGEAESIISKAEKVREMEDKVFKKILEGIPFNDMLNTEEHYEKLKKGLPSTFKFTG